MDTSSFSAVGDQLEGFLSKQFTPPDGTQAVLGFFGSGLAVEPTSFIGDDGKYNPARVNAWLNISLDVINAIQDHQVGSAVMSASQLMQAIGGSAMSTSAAGSDTMLMLAKMKSQLMAELGGATVIQTAPLNWYDPSLVAQWPKYGMKIGADAPAPAPTPTPAPSGTPPVSQPPLWVWRTLPHLRPETFISIHPEAIVPHPQPIAAHPEILLASNVSHVMLSPSVSKAALDVGAMHMVNPNLALQHASKPLNLMTAHVHQTAAAQPAQSVHVINGALAFHYAAKAAADQASAQRVDAPSMSIELNYCLVGLSRAPWWSDILVGMTNWYVPGQHKDSWVGAASAERCFGTPVSLILTANVQITASWSESDRAAAASNSHVGPWVLAGSEFQGSASSGKATLTIPSVQAIGCIYRIIPSLPPVGDPALVVSPGST